MGVAKEPVPIMSVSPNPVCLTNTVTVDLTGSYAPGSTITNRRVDFGDGNVTDPAGLTTTNIYATAGEFTVTVTITEGTGITQTVTQEVNVQDCSQDAGGGGGGDDDEGFILTGAIYAATNGSGIWYFEE
jgi:hypothetical protein